MLCRRRRALAAKGIDALLMQLGIVNRPAFLLDALCAIARIALQRPLVLPTLAHVRRGAWVGRGLSQGGCRKRQKQRGNRDCA
jgi:hypothetical protein